MNLDVRLPIGLMFTVYGLTLAIYGLITFDSPAYERSLGLNVNLIWGGVLFVFGAVVLVAALKDKKSGAI